MTFDIDNREQLFSIRRKGLSFRKMTHRFFIYGNSQLVRLYCITTVEFSTFILWLFFSML